MDKEKHCDSSQPKNGNGQIIQSTLWEGPAQMASDVLMLERLKDNADILIRFYQWKGLWLSIGKHQKGLPKEWINLVTQKKLNIVRRPSGGNAVLHSGGITYALAWNSPPRKRHQAYFEASKWLSNCFNDLDIPLRFGNQSQRTSSENCFSTSTVADLVDQNGVKRVGSAQYWKNGKLLQHGEILLNPPVDIWFEIFNQKAPPPISLKISRIDLEKLLLKSLISYWRDIEWKNIKFEYNEIKEIQKNSKDYLVKVSNSDF